MKIRKKDENTYERDDFSEYIALAVTFSSLLIFIGIVVCVVVGYIC